MAMDAVDIQLMELLWQDGRQGLEELAVKLKVSIPTVGRRIDRLEKEQAIRIVAAVDPSKVGSPFSVMMGLELAPNRVGAAIRELGARRSVLTVLRTIGRYDAWASLWFRHPRELADFIEVELPQIKGIKRTETFHLLRNSKSPFTTLDPALMDSPDRDLISLLQLDGRRKNSELAEILNVSPSTIGRQIKRLIETGTIRIAGYPLSREGEVHAFLGIRTDIGSLKVVTAALAQFRAIRWLSTCTGRYDIFANAAFQNNQEMADFITRDVSRIEGVEFNETSLVVESRLYYQARNDEYWASKKSASVVEKPADKPGQNSRVPAQSM
jgi:Lrp/AsnC family transcriptional regulator for asnA, asnC and gidA